MVKFDNDYKNSKVKYSFPEFDERVAKAFEAACKQLFEAIKEPILQDYKMLSSAVEEVASTDEFYGKSYKLDEFLLDPCDVVHIPVSSAVGRGKLTINTVPLGLFCPTAMLPPLACTASCTILSPRPLPPEARERALSTR